MIAKRGRLYSSPSRVVGAGSLSDEEERRFLRALEGDEEFRLAVAGLIGLREALKEPRRLREDSNKLSRQ